MKYNLQKIMLRAWRLYREKKELSFAECLHRAWLSAKAEAINAKRIEEAKATAGVIHGSKALFGTELIWGSRGDGKAYKARFFGRSQVHEIAIA